MLPHRQAGNYATVLLGTAISAFGLYNVHAQTGLTEGGIFGITLFLRKQFGISPAISEWVLDVLLLILASRLFGGGFMKKALLSTCGFSVFYAIFEQFPPLLPDLSNQLLLAAVLGALLLALGTGLVLRAGGACGGDDALALMLSSRLHLPIAAVYLVADGAVLALASSYLTPAALGFSLLTTTLSSLLLGRVQPAPQVQALAGG